MNWRLGLAVTAAMGAHGCSSDVDELMQPLDAPASSALTASPAEPECERDPAPRAATRATSGSTGRVEISDFFIGGGGTVATFE